MTDSVFSDETAETIRASDAFGGSRRGFRTGSIRAAYFDFDVYVQDPGDAERAVQEFVLALVWLQREKGDIDFVGFIKKNDKDDSSTIGALPLAAAICTNPRLWLRHLIVRLDRAPQDRIKLDVPSRSPKPLAGTRIALITDHITTGGEILHATQTLQAFGADVLAVFGFAMWTDDFKKEGAAVFEKLGVDVHALYHLRPPENQQSDKANLVKNEEFHAAMRNNGQHVPFGEPKNHSRS